MHNFVLLIIYNKMKSIARDLFPAKFLCLIGHIGMIIIIYFVNEDNIFAGIPYTAQKNDSDYNSANDSLLAGLSFSIIVMIFELIIFFFGVTFQYPIVNILSIGFHSIGVLFLTWFCCYHEGFNSFGRFGSLQIWFLLQ